MRRVCFHSNRGVAWKHRFSAQCYVSILLLQLLQHGSKTRDTFQPSTLFSVWTGIGHSPKTFESSTPVLSLCLKSNCLQPFYTVSLSVISTWCSSNHFYLLSAPDNTISAWAGFYLIIKTTLCLLCCFPAVGKQHRSFTLFLRSYSLFTDKR